MSNIVIMLVLLLVLFLIFVLLSQKENLSLPTGDVFTDIFNKIYNTPKISKQQDWYYLPYCTDKLGRPVPCNIPCSEFNPACKFKYPVPVFSGNIGAYSPNIWSPGAPVN
jgi:hypothetical protein